ncbi:MAG: UvrD-helicase domain-containing protein [Flavobacteriaceae bacterium]
MNKSASFIIYNASAGSGKTFTLVKAYLSKLISSNKPDFFKHILAITFTNKAVGEMKERILENLFAFSEENILETQTEMFSLVCEETQLNPTEVHKRAKNAVNYILHNFSSFDVETIDRFNHRLIRTFARDLKLPTNFEVHLDVETLMAEAVDKLITKVGIDEELTPIILDFSFEKVAEDKSWDISSDLRKIGKLLYSENEIPHTDKLKDKTLTDFKNLKSQLVSQQKLIEKKLTTLAEDFFDLMIKNSLTESDFNRGYLPGYFKKIADTNFDVLTGAKWQESLADSALYPQRVTDEVKEKLDQISPQIVAMFNESKTWVYQLEFIETLSRNVNSLSLINAIQREYLSLQEEKNILPISEFNVRINKEIKQQPAPFIYERLGEKYKHFFVDEFQDTSQLQWQNLTPLIENALSQFDSKNKTGSLMLVGDAKQSIYRWRGGDPDQFIKLYDHFNPFPAASKEVKNLETNYRSYDELIQFNNSFFTFVSNYFGSENHKELYTVGNNQRRTAKTGGFVSLSFIDAKNVTESDELYPPRVLEIINNQLSKGYSKKDICILVRKNKQGIVLAEFLANHQMEVISSEALLLDSAPEIQFILDILKIIQNFDDKKSKANILYFLHSHLKIEQPLHNFIEGLLPLSKIEFEKTLRGHEIHFDYKTPTITPLYDLCETICRNFSLSQNRVAYVQSFLESVFEFTESESTTINDFLDFWETKKKKSSVDMSSDLDAIKIMTIHKAKGLEYPVVIYPYADDDIHDFKKDKLWFPLDESQFSGFSEMLIPVSKKMKNFGELGNAFYEAHAKKSELDVLNIVYVAMTRAAEQLFIISNKKNSTKENTITNLYCNYLKNMSVWEETQEHYEFGNPARPKLSKPAPSTTDTISLDKFAETIPYTETIQIATNKSSLWDTHKEKAIQKGDLIHNLLSKIKQASDLEYALKFAIDQGDISKEQSDLLGDLIENLLKHPLLSGYYNEEAVAENEIEIFTKDNQSLRPDRINFISKNTVSIIDYKTGAKNPKHIKQIDNYGSTLSEMGFHIKEKLIVYINEEVEVLQMSTTS